MESLKYIDVETYIDPILWEEDLELEYPLFEFDKEIQKLLVETEWKMKNFSYEEKVFWKKFFHTYIRNAKKIWKFQKFLLYREFLIFDSFIFIAKEKNKEEFNHVL